jgi:invasion protein IalB
MSLLALFLRGAAGVAGLALALGVALAPAHPQEEPVTKAPQSGKASSWVKLCDRRQVKSEDKNGNDVVKGVVETCRTLTEQIHPGTGMLMIGVTLQQTKRNGRERHTLAVTVPKGVAMKSGAAIVVFPADLWLKVQRNKKLDTRDDTRLKARTARLQFKRCAKTGCIAEAEATPLLIDLLKGNAGLVVLTVRAPSMRPVLQPVPLDGFSEVLAGPATDTRKFQAARAKLMKEIAARRKELK